MKEDLTRKYNDVLRDLGIKPNKKLSSDEIVYSLNDAGNLKQALLRRNLDETAFYLWLLEGREAQPEQSGRKKKNPSVDILSYDPLSHDITTLLMAFEEQVVGGERNIMHEFDLIRYVASARDSKEILGYISYLMLEDDDLDDMLTDHDFEIQDKGFDTKDMQFFLIDEIIVLPTYRGAKLGYKLHQHLMDIALATGEVDAMFTYAHDQSRVITFFESLGYRSLGNKWTNDYGQTYLDMALPLNKFGEMLMSKLAVNPEDI